MSASGRLTCRGLAAALLWLSTSAGMAAPQLLDFSERERSSILSHGPWPPAPARDPGNALSGQPAAIALGQLLFFDRRLSSDGHLSCASCHLPAQAFTDRQARAVGRQPLERNTPSLWNAVHQRWYGWDGATDSLWSQAIGPLTDPREIGSSAEHLQSLLASDRKLACQVARLSPLRSTQDPQAALVVVAKALGAFVATLVGKPSSFDRFRGALARGDRRAAAKYPLAAQRGLRLFVGTGQCSTCHVGAMFTNGEFGDIGMPFFVRPGVVDPGRHGGIAALQANPFNLLSQWSDNADGETSLKTRHVAPQHRNFGEFKVPSLRNVALTAPYMHDGQLASLDDVVRHYSEFKPERLHADGERILRPLALDAAQRADMVAFLRTLSEPGAQRWTATKLQPCATDKKPPQRPSA